MAKLSSASATAESSSSPLIRCSCHVSDFDWLRPRLIAAVSSWLLSVLESAVDVATEHQERQRAVLRHRRLREYRRGQAVDVALDAQPDLDRRGLVLDLAHGPDIDVGITHRAVVRHGSRLDLERLPLRRDLAACDVQGAAYTGLAPCITLYVEFAPQVGLNAKP